MEVSLPLGYNRPMPAITKQLEPILINEVEAAELLHTDLPTVKQLVATGQLPLRVLAGQRLIPVQSLKLFAGTARWRYQEIEG